MCAQLYFLDVICVLSLFVNEALAQHTHTHTHTHAYIAHIHMHTHTHVHTQFCRFQFRKKCDTFECWCFTGENLVYVTGNVDDYVCVGYFKRWSQQWKNKQKVRVCCVCVCCVCMCVCVYSVCAFVCVNEYVILSWCVCVCV